MGLLSLEHSQAVYRANLVLHGLRPFGGWCALRHQVLAGAGACVGVTTTRWDHAFGSAPALARRLP